MNKPFPIEPELNVLGEPLQPCSSDPLTGFFRTGRCLTGPDDVGRHTICAEMTAEFLAFSKSRGNDLTTPRPEMAFPGLVPSNRWAVLLNGDDKAIAAAGHIGEIPCRPPIVTKRLAQGFDMEAQAGIRDMHATPDAVDQDLVGHHLAGMFGQRDQQIERPAAEADRPAVLLQPAL